MLEGALVFLNFDSLILEDWTLLFFFKKKVIINNNNNNKKKKKKKSSHPWVCPWILGF